jgi:hypothetical protein
MRHFAAAAVLTAATLGLALPGLSQPAAPPDAVKLLSAPATVPFGEIAEDCLEDKVDLYYVIHLSQYGAPEDRRDTLIQYDKARGFIHVAMFGGSKTTDAAKQRLESRKAGLDYAVKVCAKELGKGTKELYSTIEMTYTPRRPRPWREDPARPLVPRPLGAALTPVIGCVRPSRGPRPR